jgi:hypothetical protein
MLNALMDKVGDPVAFKKSIFSSPKYKISFWSKDESAKSTKFIKFTKYRPDAWHLSKSGMIVFDSFGYFLMFVAGIFTGIQIWKDVVSTNIELTISPFIWFILCLFVFHESFHGAARIWSFNLFYNLIFKKS